MDDNNVTMIMKRLILGGKSRDNLHHHQKSWAFTGSLLFTAIGLLLGSSVFSQSLTLKQCLELAKEQNSSIKIANFDAESAQKKIGEQVGSILPQVDNTSSFTDNLKMSTTLLPGEFFGKDPGTKIPVQMGSKMNLSTGFSATQKIFDPTFYPNLRSAKFGKVKADQSAQQTFEQAAYDICKAYYQVVIAQKQLEVLESTLKVSEHNLQLSEDKLRNGVVKKLDVDKVRVSTVNTRTQLHQSVLSYRQALNNLKYVIGIPLDSLITLSDTSLAGLQGNAATSPASGLNFEKVVDYQLKQNEVEQQRVEKSKILAGYFPTLSFSYSYGYSAMDNSFNFFTKDAKWYSSSSIGLTLKVPIFDGFQKRHKQAQANLSIRKAEEQLRYSQQTIAHSYQNYEMQLSNAMEDIKDQQENLQLAQSVFKDTQAQFQEGISSSLDMVQAESSLRDAQSNYFSKLLTLYIARLDLEQSRGMLLEFINFK